MTLNTKIERNLQCVNVQSPRIEIFYYNTPQLLDQKVSDAKLIFCAVLCSILV